MADYFDTFRQHFMDDALRTALQEDSSPDGDPEFSDDGGSQPPVAMEAEAGRIMLDHNTGVFGNDNTAHW